MLRKMTIIVAVVRSIKRADNSLQMQLINTELSTQLKTFYSCSAPLFTLVKEQPSLEVDQPLSIVL